MGTKAKKMNELMGQLSGPKNRKTLAKSEAEARDELPLEIMVHAKQDVIHTEKCSERKVVIKRIYFRKN